jgi:L-rhamnonate dehydratase
MKITNVRAIQPITPESPPDWRTSLGQILIAVDTDTELTGYGVGGGGLAGIHVVRTVLRDLLLGRNPDDIGKLWDEMYAATLPFGRKGLAIMAQSGVDLALWDLRGKVAEQPVAALLGGSVGEAIPAYITVWDNVPADLVAGFGAIKLHCGKLDSPRQIDLVVDKVDGARKVVGDNVDLMIDAWMQWDLDSTLAVADACAPCNLAWIEEPLPIDDREGYAQLARRCPVPIAGGEHEFTALGFHDVIQGRLHTILQPDVCWCGGLTELIKIYKLARSAGLRVCPHRGAEVWGLHAIAALDPQPLAESPRPWMAWVGNQPPIIDGFVQLTDAPGFGVEIDEAELRSIADRSS